MVTKKGAFLHQEEEYTGEHFPKAIRRVDFCDFLQPPGLENWSFKGQRAWLRLKP